MFPSGMIPDCTFTACRLPTPLLILPSWHDPWCSSIRTFRLPTLSFILPSCHDPLSITVRTCRLPPPWLILPSSQHPTWNNFRIRSVSISWFTLQCWRSNWWYTFHSRSLLSTVTFILPTWQDPGWNNFRICNLLLFVIFVNILSRHFSGLPQWQCSLRILEFYNRYSQTWVETVGQRSPWMYQVDKCSQLGNKLFIHHDLSAQE